MPDTSPASDAGVGAEALLGLASGHRIRLPSVCSLPDATEPASSTHTFHPPPQRNSFLPSPPLHLPDPPPPPIHPLPTPSANLRPSTTKRLPTLAEWAPIPLQPLHPPHPSPERPWPSSSNLPAPYAYTHSQLPWNPHPRPHQFQQPQQAYYSYHNPQPLPSPRNLNTSALHTTVTPLPPPFALPVPRTDVTTLRPCVPHIPTLDHLCKAAAANVSSSSLRSIAAAHPSPHPSPVIGPSLHPPSFNAPLESCTDIVEQPVTPPVRARGLADLINPTDSSPATTDNASNLIRTPIVSRSSYELSEEQAAPPLSLPLLPIRPISSSVQPLIPESSQFFEETPETMGRKSAKKKTTSVDAAFTSPVPISHSTSVPKSSAKPDRKSTSSTPESTSSKREQCNTTEDSPNENNFADNSETEITRCPCGSSESSGFMIACDDCNTWQHSRCMGYRRRSDLPEKYYCNLCRPEKMRIGCIAHPRYKDRNGKDREMREVKRDQEGLLAVVKPTELRKIFLADFRHKKSLLSAGKDHMLMKYASLMRIQFPKHRQGVVDGLTVLLDMSCSDVSEKLDLALHKLRQPSENDVTTERRGGSTMSVSDSIYKESLPRSVTNGKLGSKLQRFQAGSSESPEELSPVAPENSQPIDHALDVDSNDLGSARGMSREERKLRETMKLFARMEERERDRKRPRAGDNINSPKSGLQSRPKTPRTGSRTTSKPGTPNAPVDWDDRKSRTIADRDESSGCAETSRNQDGDDDDNAVSPVKDENAFVSEKTPKYDNSRHSHKSTPSWKSEAETGIGTFKRDRSKSERSALRRRDSADTSSPAGAKRQLMSERTRSHDLKRRKIGARDIYVRSAKDETKRDTRSNFSLHVPGPTVLLSKLVPECRLSQLELEARKRSDGEGSGNARKAHLPFKKNNVVRQEHLPWGIKLMEATPVKKRVRIPLVETKVNIVDSACGNDANRNFPNDRVMKHNVGIMGGAEHISEPNEFSNKAGEWKKFCLKKRRAMLDVPLIKGDASSPHSKDVVVSDELAIISPVSPSGQGTSSTPSSDTAKNGLTTNIRPGSIKPICSPKLRSSPIGGTPIPRLRSIPPPAAKRARSSATNTPSKFEQTFKVEGKFSVLASNVNRVTVNTEKKALHPGNEICKTDLRVTEGQGQRSNGTHPLDQGEEPSKRKREAAGEQEAPKCEAEVSGKRSKYTGGSNKPIVIPLSKPAPSLLGNGTRLGLDRTNTPRKSQSSGTGISIRSVPISQMTDIGQNTASGLKCRQVVSNEAPKTEPKKVVEGTIDILQHRLERFANPAVNGGSRRDSVKCLNGTIDSVGVDGVAVGVQASTGASSITNSEKFRRGGDVRSFSVEGYVNGDRPTSDTKEGWKDNAWSSGALPSFVSHKRTHGYHHTSSRLNRNNDANSGPSNGGGVSGYGLARTDEERKDWTRGHEASYRGGTSYGWGDAAGRNGRRRR